MTETFSVDYAFTITLRPKCYIHEPEKQYDLTSNHIVKILSSLSKAFTLIAEATRCYNCHFHGVIKFTITSRNEDFMKKFYAAFRNDTYVGFVNIKQMTNSERWIEYLSKDFVKTFNSIKRRPILFDWFAYFREYYEDFANQWEYDICI